MEAMKKVVDVNILGTCRVAKAFLPLLRKSNGRLVVVTSSFGYVTMPLGTPYSMTKHAAVSMVDGPPTGVLRQGRRHHSGHATSLQDQHQCSFVFTWAHHGGLEEELPRGRRRLHTEGDRQLDRLI
ncbi:D-beta-hydroxybutyrate dehydrogenase, mitochondrial-like [Rhipicephalus sanguineus]|uniref:D-beta-hydroxybutyrate dehydrogenase, mitochondrial-like n=1 Tax=Rhipicephalus sanguineus TaxID=34632 RepID=UPI0020C45CB5|nr:D-beta-hydroxybutyrate dehydrogenase, mitochondrial-like [Rhipicephalus sanguineus]